MAGYGRQIIAASAVAAIIVVGIGLGVYYIQPQLGGSTISSSYITTASRTASPLSVVTNSTTVKPDQAVKVSFIQSMLLQGNVTKIAYTLASQLDELPISGPNISQGGLATYYAFKTAKNSTIQVSVNPPPTSVQVDYRPQGWYSVGNATTLNPNFSATSADNKIQDIMSALGIPLSTISLYDQIRSLSPNDYVVQQAQSFQNMPLESLGSNPDHTFYYGASGGFYYDYNPAKDQLKRLIIDQPYWFDIPSNFPLNVSPTTAQTIAENYAIHSLGMSSITNVQVYFAPIENQYLYYAVSVSNNNGGYIIVIDPSNGQIGLPGNATTTAGGTTTVTTYSCTVSTITGSSATLTTFALTTECQPV